MIRTVLIFALVCGLVLSGYALTQPAEAEAASGTENLKVLPKKMSKKEVKTVMKDISKSLGVQCDFCHDTDDFSKDTKHKEVARNMMRMTTELNKKYFKGKSRVTCMTCHQGNKEPKH